MSPTHSRLARLNLTSRRLGVGVLLVVLAVALVAFNRAHLGVLVHRGDTVQAEFSRVYKLKPYESVVKLAGVKVGTVTEVEPQPGHGALVSMKLDKGTRDKLGTQPSAAIRPALVVGGAYYVDLKRGGLDGSLAKGATIPLDRTTVPVELDKVLSTLTPNAQKAVQGTIGELDTTLRQGGRDQLRRLAAVGPDVLKPAGRVIDAVRGTNPDTDLTRLVVGVQQTAKALSDQHARLATILEDLDTTSAAFDGGSPAVARAVADGPRTLQVTRAGLADLDGTLDRLTTTAQSFRPAARELNSLLVRLDPVLAESRPVINDARALMAQARPLVDRLVPTAQHATGMLQDFRGPVLDRLTGPITTAVLSPWHGTGIYSGGGNDHLLYEETGYFLAHGADVFKFHDRNGAAGRLMAGVGVSSLGGVFPMSIEQYLESLGLQQPLGPQEGTASGAPGLVPPPAAGPDAGLGLPLPSLDQSLNLPLVLGSN